MNKGLEKNFDVLVVGKNYLSFLLALRQIEQGQKVLILDDQRLSRPHFYGQGLGMMEYFFLKIWARYKGIKPLQELDGHLVHRPLHFFLKDYSWLQLHSRPSQNLLEFLRRLGNFFGPEGSILYQELAGEDHCEEFDRAMEKLAKDCAQSLFYHQRLTQTEFKTFLKDTSPFVQKVFALFESFFEQTSFQDNKKAYLLYYLSQFFFFKGLPPSRSSSQNFLLLLYLLGPSYFLQYEALERDLEEFFRGCGGQIKKTWVRDWKFHKKKPWCLELASFEGVIYPQKIAFMGENLSRLPFRLKKERGLYEDMILENSVSLEAAGHLPEGHFIFGNETRVGTSFPLWSLERLYPVEKRYLFRVHFFALKQPGSKIDFLEDTLLALLVPDLLKIFPWMKTELGEWRIYKGEESYLQKKTPSPSRPHHGMLHFFDPSSPFKGQPIQNVYHFGHNLESPLALYHQLFTGLGE